MKRTGNAMVKRKRADTCQHNTRQKTKARARQTLLRVRVFNTIFNNISVILQQECEEDK